METQEAINKAFVEVIHNDLRDPDIIRAMVAGVRKHQRLMKSKREILRLQRYFSDVNEFHVPRVSFVQKEQKNYVFNAFRPDEFAQIQDQLWPLNSQYEDSIDIDLRKTFARHLGTSDSFFLESSDGELIYKTLSMSEADFLLKIMPQYLKHIDDNPNTLLAPIYGLYRLEVNSERDITFIVMKNIFTADLTMKKKFDINGSMVDISKISNRPESVLGDADFISSRSFQIGPDCHKRLILQLEKDLSFLESINCVNYSLLCSVYNPPSDEFDQYTSVVPPTSDIDQLHEYFGGMRGTDSENRRTNCILFCGLVDYLEEYCDEGNPRKVELENKVIQPREYSLRLSTFFRYWSTIGENFEEEKPVGIENEEKIGIPKEVE